MLAAANGEHKRHIMEQLLHGAAGNKKEQRIRRHFREHIANTGDILGVLLLELARFFFLWFFIFIFGAEFRTTLHFLIVNDHLDPFYAKFSERKLSDFNSESNWKLFNSEIELKFLEIAFLQICIIRVFIIALKLQLLLTSHWRPHQIALPSGLWGIAYVVLCGVMVMSYCDIVLSCICCHGLACNVFVHFWLITLLQNGFQNKLLLWNWITPETSLLHLLSRATLVV